MFCFGNDTVIYNTRILAGNLRQRGKNSNLRCLELEKENEVGNSAKDEYFESESFNDVLPPP